MTVADLSLVTNNCTTVYVHHLLGELIGTIYHTPWIGMQIPDDREFVKLCLNYDSYMVMEPTFGDRKYSCMSEQETTPCMHLGDVEVHWPHEVDADEVREKFLRRRDRARDAGKVPYFFWSDYQSYQNCTSEEREAMIVEFLSLPKHQRFFVRKEDFPEWRDQSFDNRTMTGVHANILGWPHGNRLEEIVAEHLKHYGK